VRWKGCPSTSCSASSAIFIKADPAYAAGVAKA
jgi:hypothetical protein